MSHLTEIDNSGSVIFGPARSEYVNKTFLRNQKKSNSDEIILLRSVNEAIISLDRLLKKIVLDVCFCGYGAGITIANAT